MLTVIATDPLQNQPPFEKLVGNLAGAYSRRINVQHRLVYDVDMAECVVRVVRMWSRYEWQGRGRCYRGGSASPSCGTAP